MPGFRYIFSQQPDKTISQANPVSGTWYPILNTTKNVRIIGLMASITWAVTQPTPLEVRLTLDNNFIIHGIANPASGTFYFLDEDPIDAATNQYLTATVYRKAFWYEARSTKVEARITWAVTQPTPLACRLKWAKK